MTAAPALARLPTEGRVFTDRRTVRLADTGPDRRARLDGLARFLHDVAEDDAADAGLTSTIGWVLRKTTIAVKRFPVLGETVRLDTFCSGVGSRWAERTTVLTSGDGPLAHAISIWVAIHATAGTPARLDERFHEVYAPSAAGRRVRVRLVLPPPPDGVRKRARPWPLRMSDFDVWDHVNNAVSWSAVEDVVDATAWMPLVADLEHVRAIEPGADVHIAADTSEHGAGVWLLDGAARGPTPSVFVAARLRPLR